MNNILKELLENRTCFIILKDQHICLTKMHPLITYVRWYGTLPHFDVFPIEINYKT